MVAWVQERKGRGDLLRVAERAPGGSCRAGADLCGTGVILSVAVAVGASGDAVVAWERRSLRSGPGERGSTIEARVRRRGHHFGAVQELTRSRGFSTITAAVGANGRATVLWSGIQGARNPYAYPVYGRHAGCGARFTTRVKLADSRAAGDLAVGPGG